MIKIKLIIHNDKVTVQSPGIKRDMQNGCKQ